MDIRVSVRTLQRGLPYHSTVPGFSLSVRPVPRCHLVTTWPRVTPENIDREFRRLMVPEGSHYRRSEDRRFRVHLRKEPVEIESWYVPFPKTFYIKGRNVSSSSRFNCYVWSYPTRFQCMVLLSSWFRSHPKVETPVITKVRQSDTIWHLTVYP